jgi:hypothetical protein
MTVSAHVAVSPTGDPAVTLTVRGADDIAWLLDLLAHGQPAFFRTADQISDELCHRGYDPTTRTIITADPRV